MIMKTKINLDSWNRKEHFLFFKQMEEPFFGVTTTIDCTKAFEKSNSMPANGFPVSYLIPSIFITKGMISKQSKEKSISPRT